MSDTYTRNRDWADSEHNPFRDMRGAMSDHPDRRPALVPPVQGRLFDPDKYTDTPSSQKTLEQVKEIKAEVAEIKKMFEEFREILDTQAESIREITEILIDNE